MRQEQQRGIRVEEIWYKCSRARSVIGACRDFPLCSVVPKQKHPLVFSVYPLALFEIVERHVMHHQGFDEKQKKRKARPEAMHLANKSCKYTCLVSRWLDCINEKRGGQKSAVYGPEA